MSCEWRVASSRLSSALDKLNNLYFHIISVVQFQKIDTGLQGAYIHGKVIAEAAGGEQLATIDIHDLGEEWFP